jgi:hypothetical protein
MPPFGLTCPTPLSKEAELALVEVHVNAVLCPERIVPGFAEKELTVGVTGTPTSPTHPVRNDAISPNTPHRSASLLRGISIRIISVKIILYPHSDADLRVGVACMGKREPSHVSRR